MEDGQQKEKVWNGASATCLPIAASSLELSPVSLSGRLQSLPVPSHPPCQATQLFLASVLPPCHPYRHPTSRKKSYGFTLTQRCCNHIWLTLIFSSFLLFLNLARVGKKEVGTSGRGQSPLCWLADSPRGRKVGPCALRQVRGSSPLGHPHQVPFILTWFTQEFCQDQWPHPSLPHPYLHL